MWMRTIVIFASALSLLAGCDRGKSSGKQTAFVVVSGDTSSWITPCGCTTNQSGGLLRRGTYLKKLAERGQVIYADVGGAVSGNSEYQRMKFEAILRGEIAMGVAAHNIGGAEASMGPQVLRELSARLQVPFLSANVTDASGSAIAPASKIVSACGRHVALIGLLSPRFAAPAIRIDDPQAALTRAVAPIKGKYDTLIVLAYMPEDELEAFATSSPEADAVIGGPTGQAISPAHVGHTLMAAATNKGKFVIELKLPTSDGAGALGGSVVELGPGFADDDAQKANLQAYLGDLKARDFTVEQTALVATLPSDAPASYRIAGTQSCAQCHVGSHQAWLAQGHANALKTLKTKGFDVDPACQQCHTTGYGLPGGFVSLKRSASSLDGVGCENCHGPSAAHVANPKTRTPFTAADQCVRCHDHENSPKFNYAEYWPRVKHGLDPRASIDGEHQ